jgi:hypothetical protein
MIKEIIQLIRQMFTWFVIVTPWERGVRVRMGRHMKEMMPGIHLRIPFIDRFYRQSIRRRSVLIPAMTLTTSDGKTLTVGAFFWYEIQNVIALYDTLHDAHDTIESEVSGLMSRYIIAHTHEQCRAEQLSEFVLENLDLGKYGIGGFDFAISNHAEHKTYRLITGEPRQWSGAERLNTSQALGDPSPGI